MIAPCGNVLWENLYIREVLIIIVELGTTLSNFAPLDLKIVPLLSPKGKGDRSVLLKAVVWNIMLAHCLALFSPQFDILVMWWSVLSPLGLVCL